MNDPYFLLSSRQRSTSQCQSASYGASRYEGRIPGVKLGKHLRFKKDDLDRFIEDGIENPSDIDGRLS
jgi:hypothetical protein